MYCYAIYIYIYEVRINQRSVGKQKKNALEIGLLYSNIVYIYTSVCVYIYIRLAENGIGPFKEIN